MKRSALLAVTVLTLYASSALPAKENFTGFWKENCDDPYGLQIKPYRDDTYTVTFCGPGDPHCNGAPDPATATTIEGDKQYDVLSPDKVRINSEGYSPTYTKCTTDVHPLLEYSAADKAEGKRGFAVAILIHVLYFVGAVFAYRFFHKRTVPVPAVQRRVYRSGLAALFFSPGMFWAWPFVSPTFAFPALLVHLLSIPQTGAAFLPAQLIYSVGPILLVWGLLFSVAHFRAKLAGNG